MNIVFMGTPEYAAKILRALTEAKFQIAAVFTQPDKPVGRKQILTPSEVKVYAQQHLPTVPIFQPASLKDEAVAAQIKELKPDFIVVAAYGKILPQSVLDIAPCINLHASILPKYRGASPIHVGAAHEIPGMQPFGALQVGLGQLQLAAGRQLIGTASVDQRLEVHGINAGQHLPGCHGIARIHLSLDDAASGLEGVADLGACPHLSGQGPAIQERCGPDHFGEHRPGRLFGVRGFLTATGQQESTGAGQRQYPERASGQGRCG